MLVVALHSDMFSSRGVNKKRKRKKHKPAGETGDNTSVEKRVVCVCVCVCGTVVIRCGWQGVCNSTCRVFV